MATTAEDLWQILERLAIAQERLTASPARIAPAKAR